MFNQILAPLDGSTLAECVLPHVAMLARSFAANVTLLYVVECAGTRNGQNPIDPLQWQMRKAEAQAYLNEQIELLGKAGIEAESALLEGHAAQRIIEYARDHGSDLIVMSSHGDSGVNGWNNGSLVYKVLQRVHISALVIRAYLPTRLEIGDLRYQHIVTLLDGSPRADVAIAPAARLAEANQAQLILSHVLKAPELFQRMPPEHGYLEMSEQLMEYNHRQADDYMEQLQNRLPGDVTTRVVVGDDVTIRLHQLIEEESADLIVMSAHGRSGKAQWPYGSVTTNLLSYASVPVLMVQDLNANQIEPTPAERYAKEIIGH